MKDQVMSLVQMGVKAAYINSSLTPAQIRVVLDRACGGQYKIIYVAPERLLTGGFLQFARNAPLDYVTVDEAHCVSKWGQDFRPSYLDVRTFIAKLPRRPVLGAPLTHDFAVISLSDRLTPWETIENRLRCAAEGNFAIAIYNPASHGRPDHLKRACDILLRVLPEERLCGIVRNIGREGQSSRILTLGELQAADVDMFCTVFVGNSSTKVVNGALITPRGYRNV